ncbi:MAG: hypothetical protein GQ535_06525 [Rhodobacteraceae bacterium]|nr:hypothetical protein [Paracoccaceae bacterium]
MDIQEVDLGNTIVRACLQGSKRLVVGFETGGNSRALARPERPAWAQKLVADAGWDGLHIMPKVLDWYQAPELWRFFKTKQSEGSFEAYKSVVTYGCSMGGFAALAFAKLAGAKRVVALQPRTSLQETPPWHSYHSARMSYNRVGLRSDALNGLAAGVEVQIFADPFHARDWAHATRVTEVEIYRVPFAGHNIPLLFKEIGIMGEVSRHAITGALTRACFFEALRGRRESPIYEKNMQAALLRRGQPEGAVV